MKSFVLSSLLVLIVVIEVNCVVQHTVQLLLAGDDCVPKDLKNTIKHCWTKQGQQIWDSCSPNTGSSNNRGRGQMEVSYEAMEAVSACIGSSLLNLTDMNAKEMVELGNNMLSKDGLNKCAGKSITLTMLLCSRPKIMATQYGDYPLSPRIYFD